MKRVLICGAALLSLLTSCAVRSVTIYCEPQSAAIYIDGEYVGNGIVNYSIPKGMRCFELSCTEDGESFVSRTVYTRGISPTISIYLSEYMQYSSEHKTMTTY